jgi:hypothetical protein
MVHRRRARPQSLRRMAQALPTLLPSAGKGGKRIALPCRRVERRPTLNMGCSSTWSLTSSVAFAIFLVVRFINRLHQAPPVTPTTKACPYCISVIPPTPAAAPSVRPTCGPRDAHTGVDGMARPGWSRWPEVRSLSPDPEGACRAQSRARQLCARVRLWEIPCQPSEWRHSP